MAETLKEFLIGVGWKVDDAGESKFKNTMRQAVIEANLVSTAIESAVKSMSEIFQRITTNLDGLYWASRRTGSSVSNIKAFGYAISQLGGTIEGAQQSLENFGRNLRNMPGYEQLLKNLGITTRVDGKLRDTTDLLLDFGKVLKSMPQSQRAQYWAQLGIDENTGMAMLEDVAARMEELKAKMRRAGLDPEQAAKDSAKFMQIWREFGATLDTIFSKIQSKVVGTYGDSLKSFMTWLDQNSEKISDALAALLKSFLEVVKGLTEWITENPDVQKTFDAMAKSAKELADNLNLIVAPLKLIRDIYRGLGTPGDFQRRQGGIEAPGGKDPFADLDRKRGTKAPDDRNWWERTMPKALGGKDAPAEQAPAAGTTSSTGSISPEGRALLDTIASSEAPGYNVMYGGRRFNSYDDHPRQNVPIASGPNAGRTSSAAGRYQFLASTWDAQKRKLGLKDFSPQNQDIAAFDLAKTTYRQRTGRDLESDLKSGDPSVIAGVGQALSGIWTSLPGGIEQGQGAGTMVGRYSRNLAKQNSKAAPSFSPIGPANAPPAMTLPPARTGNPWDGTPTRDLFQNSAPMGSQTWNNNSRGATTIAPNTNITVHGAGDGNAVAESIARLQSRSNADLIRNMQINLA